MSAFLLLTLGIVFFLIILFVIAKKSVQRTKYPRGEGIAKRLGEMQEEEKKSRLGKRLFYKIKSGLFRK